MDFGNIVDMARGMVFALSCFFAGILTASRYLTPSVTKQSGSKFLQQRKDAVVGLFKPIHCSFIQPVPISHGSASSRGNSCKLYTLLLTELQPMAAQRLDMIKLSCKVSTSC